MSKHHFYHPTSGNFQTSSKKSHLESIDMAIHQSSNGLRTNGIAEVNNNYNNKHLTHHKRAAGVSGESSSSKRTKLCVSSDKTLKNGVDGSKTLAQPQSHYNIMEKLKDLYKELKEEKSCKEVRFF